VFAQVAAARKTIQGKFKDRKMNKELDFKGAAITGLIAESH
jgi:hypothetical protein